jgi:peptide/nickel transport system ATP-binding protein
MPILEVRNLTLGLKERRIALVEDISFFVEKGEVLGILGESGCGKSLTGFAILKLFPSGIIPYDGDVFYKGISLYSLSERELLKIRGKKISIILQDPLSSLNPVLTIGEQIAEVIKYHTDLSKKEIKNQVLELLKEVGIPDPELRARNYPHELSGGLRQRAMIAMALAGKPEVLIADEPTTALDLTLQAQIIKLLLNLKIERKLSIIFITHDLGIVKWISDKIAVFYAGEIVELASAEELFLNPLHPYTISLFESYPREKTQLKSVEARPLNLLQKREGCRYYDRCEKKCKEGKKEKPFLIEKKPGHWVRCFI